MEYLQSTRGLIGTIGFLGIAKSILEVLLYFSLIAVSYKTVQALNIFINKNTK
jgi:hypothetical protein